MRYTTASAYAAFSTLSLQLTCFLLRINTWQNRCKNKTNCFSYPRSYGKYYTKNQNEAKLFFRGRCPLHPL